MKKSFVVVLLLFAAVILVWVLVLSHFGADGNLIFTVCGALSIPPAFLALSEYEGMARRRKRRRSRPRKATVSRGKREAA